MKKKKVLILVDWFYPGYKAGGPIQSCRNFIKAMDDRFEISVICSDRDMGDTASYPGIDIDQWNNYSPHTKVFYASALSVQQLLQLQAYLEPDYIYLNSMFSVRFTIYPLWLLWRNKLKAQIVLAPRGMLHQGALGFKPKKKAVFLWLLKASGLYKKIRFHATDKKEQEDISSFFSKPEALVLATNFPSMVQAPFKPVQKQPGILKCIFLSRISPKKNLAYLLRLLQQVSATVKINLTIAGDVEDKGYWQDCLAQIAMLPPHITVENRGSIENNRVNDIIGKHQLFVLTTLGENFGHAIFESFAAGRPVLISNLTPWQQLSVKKAGWDLPLQDEQAFVQVLEAAAGMGEREYNEWCNGAWQLAHEFIHGSAIQQQYLELFN